MPILLIGLSFMGLFVLSIVIYLIKTWKVAGHPNRGLNIVIFAFSLIALIISLKLFWNMGVYADEYNASLIHVSGGMFWLYMNWLRLGLLFIIFVFSGVQLVSRSR
ncbi:hypothetical protein [Rubeoparvulum massiliense]|uniref:hypothetical protein n=1 Tax=Rubeoparvulum massiliense TaxID=1631346 RepID=UPI000B1AD7B1|nr:hypothetical protein [Rubeoparvulum massiliense]